MITVDDSNNFDLETFVNLFDTAMTSSNPAVQKTLKNLLLLASIVREDQIKVDGPLRKLMKDVSALQIRLASIDLELSRLRAEKEQHSYYTATGAMGATGPVGSMATGAIGPGGPVGHSASYATSIPTITIDSSNYLAMIDNYTKNSL